MSNDNRTKSLKFCFVSLWCIFLHYKNVIFIFCGALFGFIYSSRGRVAHFSEQRWAATALRKCAPIGWWLLLVGGARREQIRCARASQTTTVSVFELLLSLVPISEGNKRNTNDFFLALSLIFTAEVVSILFCNSSLLWATLEVRRGRRSHGCGAPGVFGADSRSVVRLRGETQRLLERNKPQVRTTLFSFKN